MKRELLEETGYTGDLGKSMSCAYSTRIFHHFLARNCKKIQEPNLDDTEFVELIEKSIEDFKKQLDEGMFNDNITAYRGLERLGFYNWQNPEK
jgi:ADP-ribose pyrophosphatase